MKKINKNGWGLSTEIIIIFFFICCLLYSFYFVNKLGWLKNPEKEVSTDIENNEEENIYDTSYTDLESEIKASAKAYINKEYGQIGADTLILTVTRLTEANYLEELIDPDDSSKICTGYVEVELINEKNIYTPYINCSKYYTDGYIKRKDSE